MEEVKEVAQLKIDSNLMELNRQILLDWLMVCHSSNLLKHFGENCQFNGSFRET